jgi:hypothetical protein
VTEESPRPRFNLRGLRDKRPRDYLVRFAFGAAVSLAAALVGLRFPQLGGVFLAFPAIMPASLTLVERDGGRREAAIDAQGAILGALGLVAFACVAAFGIGPLGAVPALLAAAATWVVVAICAYALAMWWRARER